MDQVAVPETDAFGDTATVSGRALGGGAMAIRAMAPTRWRNELNQASPPLRRAIDNLDQEAWYPADLMFELLRHAHTACVDVPKGVRELARRTLHDDASSAMEPVVRVLSPTWISRHAQSVWDRYADFGTVRFVEGTMHSAQLEFTVDPALERRSGKLWCWIAGALEAVLQIAGAVDVQVSHVQGPDAGQRAYDLRWG